MQRLTVALKGQDYPVYVGENLAGNSTLLQHYIIGHEVVIVTNETIAPLFLAPLKKSLAQYNVGEFILPDGEKWKTLDTASQIFDYLMSRKCDRKTTLIALGGGVTGDITGFVAACYRRGVPFIQIPTTLLAQVDSSVGGKTGVNHPLGKNMIGAFYQPKCVLADISLLETLPDREYSAGLAEMIKYGLIYDASFYAWIEKNIERLMTRDSQALSQAVFRSCENKAGIVSLDEKEAGVRAILNFGHTFGHAIETSQQYRGLLHGEAVAVGMMMAMDLSMRMGLVLSEEIPRLETLLKKAGLPVSMPEDVDYKTFPDFMRQDKKSVDRQLVFVLLTKIGKAIIKKPGNDSHVNETLTFFFGKPQS